MLYALGGMIREYMGGGRTGEPRGDAKARNVGGASGMRVRKNYEHGGLWHDAEGNPIDRQGNPLPSAAATSTSGPASSVGASKETDPKKSRKYSAYDTGDRGEDFPQIDIETRKVVIGKEDDGSDIIETEYQFFLDGRPVTSQDAAKSYAMSIEGADKAPSFNDFVQGYMNTYAGERMGPKHDMPQTRSRVKAKEKVDIEGLMKALKQYGEYNQSDS